MDNLHHNIISISIYHVTQLHCNMTKSAEVCCGVPERASGQGKVCSIRSGKPWLASARITGIMFIQFFLPTMSQYMNTIDQAIYRRPSSASVIDIWLPHFQKIIFRFSEQFMVKVKILVSRPRIQDNFYEQRLWSHRITSRSRHTLAHFGTSRHANKQ